MSTNQIPSSEHQESVVEKKISETYTKVYDTEYERLNEAQRKAVDTIDGPVMVVAGPGTGKTQVLALRVAKILKSTQMRPWNILCLTFSKSGATAMRKRLRNVIGPDAYGVTVNTIHGFCNDVIMQNPSLFEDWSSMNQISDVERYRSLNKIIDQLMPGLHLLNSKSPYSRSRDILSRISQLKREGVTDKETLLGIADEYEEVMSQKSKEGTKAHAKNLLSAQKFRDLLEIFFRYQGMLKETGRYDFDDMILNVIEALKTEDWLRANLQERYQYILLDEFQDTNGAQYAFATELTKDPTGDNNPNFFVVGDDDQAIYRFQGANLTNILSFRERFPQAPVIALTTSYRCTQPILDAAQSLISNNTERLEGRVEGLNKKLVAATSELGEPPRMLLSASDMSELWLIADLIEERVDEGKKLSEIAVIVQTNRELLPLNEVCMARNIPTVLSGKLDLLTHPLVEQVIDIVKAVHRPTDNSALASAVSSQCFGCHPADIAVLYAKRRECNATFLDVLLGLEQDKSMHLRDKPKLITTRDLILDLHNKQLQRTVVQTLEHIYRDTGLLESIKKGELDVVDFAAAQEFFDRIKNRAYEQPEFTFAAFLDDLEYYGNTDYGDLRLTYDLPHLTQEGVQLMTAHKSKGLEFETVIITNFREGHWDKRRNPPAVSVPEDLLFGWRKEQKSYEQNQDERRVAFVGMTRAKRELIFTCPNELTTGDSIKAVSPSAFFAESGELLEETREVKHPEQMSTLLQMPVRNFDAEFETFLKKRIEQFSLSATALNHFLEDPQLFLEVDLLQRPQAKEPHFAYGNAVHHVLAKWADSVIVNEPISVPEMLIELERHLTSDELLTTKERERLVHLGKQTVERYAQTHLHPPYPIIHKVEYNISTHLEDVPMKGKIDRIDLLEPNSSAAKVIDYKTGSPKSPKQIADYGYFRQLVFYDLLIRNGYNQVEPKEFVLEFVGEAENNPVTRSFTISEEDRKGLTEVIKSVWQKVLALDFTSL